jgi:hypothetical protein
LYHASLSKGSICSVYGIVRDTKFERAVMHHDKAIEKIAVTREKHLPYVDLRDLKLRWLSLEEIPLMSSACMVLKESLDLLYIFRY